MRRVADNLGWLLTEKMLRLCSGVIVGAWVARHLGPERFGSFSYVLAFVGLLAFLPSMGLDEVARREILQSRDDEPAKTVIGTVWRARLMAGLGLWGVFTGSVWLGGWAADGERLLLTLAGLLLLQPALHTPELFFQGRGESRRVARAQLVSLGAGILMRAALVFCDASLVWFVVQVLVEVMVTTSLYWIMAKGQGLRDWWRRWDPARAADLLRSGFPLLLAGVAVSVYMKVDQVMLREMAGEAEAGIYAVAVRLSESVYFLPMATVMVLLPSWARAKEAGGARHERVVQGTYDLLTALAGIFAVSATFLSGWIVRLLFGVEFAAAAPVLAIHAWAAVFVFQGVVRSQEWVFENLNQWTLVTTAVGAVMNVILNWLWIPAWGAEGAAFATLASYGLTVWLLPFLFPATRSSALRQTKALLLPVMGWRYVRAINTARDTSHH